MTFEKLVLGRSLLNSALLRVQQRPNFIVIRNKSSTTTSSDEISDKSSGDEKIVETPNPQNLTLNDFKYFWKKQKTYHYKHLGGYRFGGYKDTEEKEEYSGVLCNLDHGDESKLYPNGEWTKEFFNKKDIAIMRRLKNAIRLDMYSLFTITFNENLKELKGVFECLCRNEETEKVSFRKMYATFRLICKIEDIARRLVDENVIDKCLIFYHVTMFDKTYYAEALSWPVNLKFRHLVAKVNYMSGKKSEYEECWISLLESSKVPLSVELRYQLKEANITECEFSKIISEIYMKLLKFDIFKNFIIEPIGREDIIKVLADLNLDTNSYKSIKILFNLEEPLKWRL